LIVQARIAVSTVLATHLFVLPILFTACGSPAPTPPAFAGRETASWLAFDVTLPAQQEAREPADFILPFEESAHAYGCRTDHLGSSTGQVIGNGEVRATYGITAYCDEGTIAIIALENRRVRVGCGKPTTRDRCEALLTKISSARN
jgi:hypothetical protein